MYRSTQYQFKIYAHVLIANYLRVTPEYDKLKLPKHSMSCTLILILISLRFEKIIH